MEYFKYKTVLYLNLMITTPKKTTKIYNMEKRRNTGKIHRIPTNSNNRE